MPKDPEELASKVAEVCWIDTHAEHAWTNNEPRPGPIRSVGYVIYEDKEAIALSESIDLMPDARRYGCTTAIPKCAITSITYLRGGK